MKKMKKKKYRLACSDCKTICEDDFTTKCPGCGSKNIVREKDHDRIKSRPW